MKNLCLFVVLLLIIALSATNTSKKRNHISMKNSYKKSFCKKDGAICVKNNKCCSGLCRHQRCVGDK